MLNHPVPFLNLVWIDLQICNHITVNRDHEWKNEIPARARDKTKLKRYRRVGMDSFWMCLNRLRKDFLIIRMAKSETLWRFSLIAPCGEIASYQVYYYVCVHMVVTCFHRVSRPNVLNHIYRATVTEYVAGSHSNALSAQQFYSYRPDPPDNPQVSCCVCYWWRICAMMLPTSRERQKRFPCRRRKDWWRTNPTDISFTFLYCVYTLFGIFLSNSIFDFFVIGPSMDRRRK